MDIVRMDYHKISKIPVSEVEWEKHEKPVKLRDFYGEGDAVAFDEVFLQYKHDESTVAPITVAYDFEDAKVLIQTQDLKKTLLIDLMDVFDCCRDLYDRYKEASNRFVRSGYVQG